MLLRTWTLALAGMVLLFAEAKAETPAGDWPQWRGPNSDGISLDTGLLKEWPENGPPVVWAVNSVGVGYSSIAVKDGRIFTQGDLDGVEHIIALDEATGRTLWAVQPGKLAELLDLRLANDFKQLDKNNDGTVSEVEALARFGWDWNKYNQPGKEAVEIAAERRTTGLFQALDQDGDGRLAFAEAGGPFRDAFEKIDATDPNMDAAALAAERKDAYIKLLDKDADGRLSRQESRGTALDRAFGRFDVRDPATNKGDDQLTADELLVALQKHEAGRDGILTREEVLKHLVQNQLTGDDQLTVAELRSAVGGYRNGMGDGPRGTPTVDGPRLYVEGGNGDVACLDAATGKSIWHVNLKADFGGNVPGWGYSESPLIVNEMVVVTPGGKAGTLLALDKLTGKTLWQSAGVTEGAHYSSPVVAEIDGIRQIVQFANQSVFGVSLDEGKPLWRYTAPANGTANCCSPIIEDNLVYASSAYGTGGGLAKILTAGSTQSAEQVYFEKKLACHHGGVVKVGDYLYSAGGGPLVCMEFKTGDIKWQSRSAGKGSLCVADGMLYILSEGHTVALAEATPEEYREHGRFKIEPRGKPAWAHPVVTGGRLYLRDQQSLTAYDVRAK